MARAKTTRKAAAPEGEMQTDPTPKTRRRKAAAAETETDPAPKTKRRRAAAAETETDPAPKTKRRKAASTVETKLVGMADVVITAAQRSKDPGFAIPIRALSNVSFNQRKGMIEMGGKKQERTF